MLVTPVVIRVLARPRRVGCWDALQHILAGVAEHLERSSHAPTWRKLVTDASGLATLVSCTLPTYGGRRLVGGHLFPLKKLPSRGGAADDGWPSRGEILDKG